MFIFILFNVTTGKFKVGNSLAVQWLGFGAFTAREATKILQVMLGAQKKKENLKSCMWLADGLTSQFRWAAVECQWVLGRQLSLFLPSVNLQLAPRSHSF